MQHLIRQSLIVGTLSLAGAGLVGVGLDATNATAPTVNAQAAQTPGAFVPIDSYRAFDSRDSSTPGRLEVSESVTITADQDTEGNQVIPDEATAVTFNITAADTRGAAYLQVTTGNRELGNTSTVNWNGDGEVIANSGVTAIFQSTVPENENLENTFAVFINGADGGSAHVIIDITGYYVPVG